MFKKFIVLVCLIIAFSGKLVAAEDARYYCFKFHRHQPGVIVLWKSKKDKTLSRLRAIWLGDSSMIKKSIRTLKKKYRDEDLKNNLIEIQEEIEAWITEAAWWDVIRKRLLGSYVENVRAAIKEFWPEKKVKNTDSLDAEKAFEAAREKYELQTGKPLPDEATLKAYAEDGWQVGFSERF